MPMFDPERTLVSTPILKNVCFNSKTQVCASVRVSIHSLPRVPLGWRGRVGSPCSVSVVLGTLGAARLPRAWEQWEAPRPSMGLGALWGT